MNICTCSQGQEMVAADTCSSRQCQHKYVKELQVVTEAAKGPVRLAPSCPGPRTLVSVQAVAVSIGLVCSGHLLHFNLFMCYM